MQEAMCPCLLRLRAATDWYAEGLYTKQCVQDYVQHMIARSHSMGVDRVVKWYNTQG